MGGMGTGQGRDEGVLGSGGGWVWGKLVEWGDSHGELPDVVAMDCGHGCSGTCLGLMRTPRDQFWV